MTRIATSIASGILSLGAAFAAVAAVKHLPAEVRAALEQTKDFQSFSSVSAVPKTVRVEFSRAVRDSAFAMAEPGAKWQATDAIRESGLPWRRLRAGAISSDFLVIFYEFGGIAHSYHVCVFRMTADSAQLVWRAAPPKGVVSLDALKSAIQSGAADDDPRYMF